VREENTMNSELTFTTGERVVLDLRDSRGDVAVKDWDGATLKITTDSGGAPYVLRDGDTFRVTLSAGGTIALPIGLPAVVRCPEAVDLRVMRAGGETVVKPVAGTSGTAAGSADAGADGLPRDFTEFADVMSEHGRRIFQDVARAVRSSGTGVSEDVARKLDEAAERIDETARRAAERIQREVEKTVGVAERYEEHGRRAAASAEERARKIAEKVARHAERHGARQAERVERTVESQAERAARQAEREAERAARHAERDAMRGARRARGRWWFTERLDEWANSATGMGVGASGMRGTPAPHATEDERLAIMKMLAEGKITTDQAAKLLDALGG
jgi:hypothetical protein